MLIRQCGGSDMNNELVDRGIASAAKRMNWREDTYTPPGGEPVAGWIYPIRNTTGMIKTSRFKARKGLTPKYAWPHGKPDGLDYYYARDENRKCVLSNSLGGDVWYASGEPDLLTLMEAGISRAFCTTLSEISIPATFVELLQWLNITRLLHAPDRDKAGMDAARKLQDALADTNIELKLFKLQGDLESKADLNSVWIDCNFDVNAFKLATIERMELKPIEPEPMDELFRPAHHPDVARDSSVPQKFLDDIASAIASRINKPFKFGGNGWANFSCITGKHEDKIDSAGWHKDGAYNCFACGTMNAKQTGELLGLDIRDYYDDEPVLKIVTAPVAESAVANETQPQSPADKARAVLESPQLTTKQPAQLYHNGDDLLTGYIGFINGDKDYMGKPVKFPFRNMHKYGGFCRDILTGMVVLIGGESGSGKTTLLETMSDLLCERGVNNAYISKEWGKRPITGRRIGRNMTDGTFTLEEALAYASNGHELSAAKRMAIAEVCKRLRSLPGKVHVFGQDKKDGTRHYLEDMLAKLTAYILHNRANGHDIRVVFWDYVQLYSLRKFTPGSSNIEEQKLDVFKDYCEIMDVVGITTSQITQGAANRVRGHGQSKYGGWLNLLDCQFLREDKANLGLMWQQQYRTVGEMQLKLSDKEWIDACIRCAGYSDPANQGWIYHDEFGDPVKTGDAVLLVRKNSLQSTDRAVGRFEMDWKHGKVVEL